jgi:hypothetical protein
MKKVTGAPVPRRKYVNIMDDIADIVETVKDSGLPDAFFSDHCRVSVQLQALSKFMNLTPIQVTVLAVVAELSDPYVSLSGMADYISCPKTRLNSLDSDFFFLEWVGYISRHKEESGLEVYQVPVSLFESWSMNHLYSPFNEREKESQAFMKRISFKVIQFHKSLSGPMEATRKYIDTQKEYYQSSSIMSNLKCASHGCPSPPLGLEVLMMLVSYCIELQPYEMFSKEEIATFLSLPSISSSELDGVLDYFVYISVLDCTENFCYQPTRRFLKSMASVLMVELPDTDMYDDIEHSDSLSEWHSPQFKPEC